MSNILIIALFLMGSILHAKGDVTITPSGLLRDGKPYFVKGVGGDKDLPILSKLGCNSIRTWTENGLDKILDDAHKHQMTVCAGIWLEPECSWFSYSNPKHTAKQLERVKLVIQKYMNHPSLLIWNVGNEAEGDGANTDYWIQLNKLCAMVRSIDNAHPTLTAVAGLSDVKAAAIEKHCPALDIVGINTYGALKGLRANLEKRQWKKPWIVTEFGPRGFWESPNSKWGRPYEQTSTEKAAFIGDSYRTAILPGGQCLGSYAFLWGQKEEATQTWFGLRDKHGNIHESMNVLEQLWTGKAATNRAPTVRKLHADFLKIHKHPSSHVKLRIEATDADNDTLTYHWELMSDTIRRDNKGKEIPHPPIANAISENNKPSISLQIPKQPGNYRVFVHITDGKGHFATANHPLCVPP